MFFSVIIPTHGSLSLLQKCIKTLKRYEKGNNYEVIVIDDGSTAKEQSLLRNYCRTENIRAILNEQNKGFAHSVNIGCHSAKQNTDVYLLCNNDIVFTQPVFSELTSSFITHKEVGVIGALLSYPNKTVQHAGMHYSEHAKAFLHTHKNVKESNFTVNQPRYCIAVTGALFAVRKEAHKVLGEFNENYFLACEDTEYCLRAWNKNYHVLYNPRVKAIHLEGGTRGKNPRAKARINHTWVKGEADSIAKFQKHLETYDIKAIEHTVSSLNTLNSFKEEFKSKELPVSGLFKDKKKIEVGSGYSPHPGYLHLDVRKGLPQLDYVCDFSKERLPFKDGEVSEILANHVIEHISFRKLPFMLSEWSRVLGADGKLILRTPNLRFIVEKYLANETTPEWPGDEDYIKKNLSDAVTPAWWANIKLFSGQDYAANFHHICFDFPMLKEVLKRFGFKSVVESKFDREFSPGELQVEAYKKEQPDTLNNNNSEVKNALIIRKGAFGDVLMATPIIKRLSDSGYKVSFKTDCLEALTNNPHVHFVSSNNFNIHYFEKIIDLDLAYEKTPKMHVIDAYSLVAFGDTETEHKLYFYLSDSPENKLVPFFKDYLKDSYTVVHAGTGWENRTWGVKNWYSLVEKIKGKVVVIGSRSDNHITGMDQRVLNLVGKLNWNETANIIKNAKLFIGPDSAPLHLAQALGTPSVGIFTCAKAEYRTTGALAVIPDIECYGCLHEEKPPVTYCGCKRGDFKCLALVTPNNVVEAALEATR